MGHLDSCALKIRPVSKKTKAGYLQVGVELYGGGIWASWFDRDLSIAGRVIVSTPSAEKGYTSKLVKIDRPLMRIPTLAIHLDRTINEAFKFNKESEFMPIAGLVETAMNAPADKGVEQSNGTKSEEDVTGQSEKHHPLLLGVLADELGCEVSDIQDFELYVGLRRTILLCDWRGDGVWMSEKLSGLHCRSLYDTQPACVGGLSNEFIFAPRIDNQMTW